MFQNVTKISYINLFKLFSATLLLFSFCVQTCKMHLVMFFFVTLQNKRDEHLLKRRNVPHEDICGDFDVDGDFRTVKSLQQTQNRVRMTVSGSHVLALLAGVYINMSYIEVIFWTWSAALKRKLKSSLYSCWHLKFKKRVMPQKPLILRCGPSPITPVLQYVHQCSEMELGKT